MPVFTFEKISPPVRGPIVPTARKQRGVILQILDRLAEARVRRSLRDGKATIANPGDKPVANGHDAAAGCSNLRF
jgi:hypothetical protein